VVLLIKLKTAQATIVANTINHKKDMARLKATQKKDLAKTKMKERSKRLFSSIPIIGTAMLFWTGKDEYDEWKKDNPGGTVEGYAKYKADLLIEVP
jgi:dipeptide/tripeptide permease